LSVKEKEQCLVIPHDLICRFVPSFGPKALEAFLNYALAENSFFPYDFFRDSDKNCVARTVLFSINPIRGTPVLGKGGLFPIS